MTPYAATTGRARPADASHRRSSRLGGQAEQCSRAARGPLDAREGRVVDYAARGRDGCGRPRRLLLACARHHGCAN
jgi:hypothetical protein